LCLSNGAVPCTHITTQSNTKIKLVHPFLSSTCIFENIFNGYYNYDKLLSVWLQAKRNPEDIKKLEFFKNNKDFLRSIYPDFSQADFLKINTQIDPKIQVYIANKDDYFSTEQNLSFFPNAIFTGAQSHTAIDNNLLFEIITK
ncbi:MAG: hypothetical protein ACRCXZ_09465, partial [Patescibacteria group bacterium]